MGPLLQGHPMIQMWDDLQSMANPKRPINNSLTTMKCTNLTNTMIDSSPYPAQIATRPCRRLILLQFAANNDVKKHLSGSAANVRELRSGGVLVEVKTREQSNAILSLERLAGCTVPDNTSAQAQCRCEL